MDANLIRMWNKTVSEDDLVYILGDFSFYDGEKTSNILKFLNGKKILVVGNHDSKFLKDKKLIPANYTTPSYVIDIKLHSETSK